MAETQQYGPNKPLSLDKPSQHDLDLMDSLLRELKAQKNFELPEESKRREDTLKLLQSLTKRLVQEVGKAKKIPEAILADAGGKISTYGSYRLGVYGPGSDIDTLIIAPKHVTRDDFFNHFPDLLKQNVKAEDITELVPVRDTSVPIIKLEICGIAVDLIFSSLQVASIPANMALTDNNLLRGLDEIDLRCLNGTRVTDRIVSCVPQSKTFRLALRAVKLWAQRRAIYGNVVGFPGGVAYAMMVAKVCQLYPNAAASRIVARFFWLIRNWQWPQPVRLANREDAPLQLREWDPKTSYHDRKHLMPIITPAYPSMNSTHNIGPSTFALIMKELGRGDQLLQEITAVGSKRQWKDLFQKHTFFTEDYKHYLSVVCASRQPENAKAWAGLCLARLRILITKIEELQGSVELAHPFNKGFDRVHACKTDAEEDKILQGSLDFQIAETKTTVASAVDIKVQTSGEPGAGEASTTTNGTAEANDSKRTIYTTTYYVGIGLKQNAKSLDVSYAINDYKNRVTSDPLYDVDKHSIRVVHVRNVDLPVDVFTESEVRPMRAPKKGKTAKATPAAVPAANKRTVSNAGMDENPDSAKRRHSGVAVANGTNGSAP